MNREKGFSLTEVLISLILVTTLTLVLLQEQRQSKQLLNQLVFRTQGSQFLDQIEETLAAKTSKFPPIPPSYHLEIQQQNHQILIHLAWLEQLGTITRKRSPIGRT
ncbi:prepilin-type N-terminal cleavage/methylation domain-containing protein [Legionella sp. PC997]|uniref:prepilin-type N-terminal cleavage/methylation domain-containing protein n=1 Tax=Legionella sp. PC997 TaxID=2755562 RepID=UPI0015FAB2CC|nr:prepilin-type N-terminal cleavage/methylation domain-containing protein [Legionella sp. PC997]QMT60685.1 prepilin-type cleavage/methylation domain-containing protein [Legionella sp. PC997]